MSDNDCLVCHADNTLTTTNAAGRAISLFVDEARLAASVHKTNSCVSCHTDITAEHPDDNRPVAPVNCARCHEPAGRKLRRQRSRPGAQGGPRGRRHLRGLPRFARHSAARRRRRLRSTLCSQAQTCGRCHAQEARDVAASVHGKAMATGERDAPTCTDCHSEHKIEALKDGSALEISGGLQPLPRLGLSRSTSTTFRPTA